MRPRPGARCSHRRRPSASRSAACPAGICRELTAYEIIDAKCDGCHACFKACPVDAITGVVKEKHVIHQDKCISCGACWDACPTEAIRFFPKAERTVA